MRTPVAASLLKVTCHPAAQEPYIQWDTTTQREVPFLYRVEILQLTIIVQ